MSVLEFLAAALDKEVEIRLRSKFNRRRVKKKGSETKNIVKSDI
ncbi:MAG: hypothetical protein ACR2L1_09060 [Pyrinomonadaceae bacterium]